MYRSEEKIVAFSDSKSTKLVNGQPTETTPVRKVFGNDIFVVTCTGSNTLPVMKDDRCYCLRLEDWMDEKIEQVDSVWKLCKSLYEFLHKECIQNIEPIILIGAQPIGDGKDVCKFFTARIFRQSFSFEEQFVTDGIEKCDLKNPGLVWSRLVQPGRWKNPNCNIITKNKGFRLISEAFFVCNSPYYN